MIETFRWRLFEGWRSSSCHPTIKRHDKRTYTTQPLCYESVESRYWKISRIYDRMVSNLSCQGGHRVTTLSLSLYLSLSLSLSRALSLCVSLTLSLSPLCLFLSLSPSLSIPSLFHARFLHPSFSLSLFSFSWSLTTGMSLSCARNWKFGRRYWIGQCTMPPLPPLRLA